MMSFDFGSLDKSAPPKKEDDSAKEINARIDELARSISRISKKQSSMKVPDNDKINRMIAEHMETYQKEFDKRIRSLARVSEDGDVLELWDGIYQTIIRMWGIKGGIGKRATMLDHLLRQNFRNI